MYILSTDFTPCDNSSSENLADTLDENIVTEMRHNSKKATSKDCHSSISRPTCIQKQDFSVFESHDILLNGVTKSHPLYNTHGIEAITKILSVGHGSQISRETQQKQVKEVLKSKQVSKSTLMNDAVHLPLYQKYANMSFTL